jgi:hypothetical protein
MNKSFVAAALFALVAGLAVNAHADLDGFLSNLNIQARADMNGFGVKLGAQFGVPVPQVQAIIRSVDMPADAFMCLQLSQWSNRRPDMVVNTYKTYKGKGWGVIAKQLGIKPGSAEFHALKRGDLYFTGAPGEVSSPGKGKGKGKDHNK